MSVIAVEPDADEFDNAADNQIIDYLTGQPVKDTSAERVLQTLARSLVDEYGFDNTQVARDQTIAFDTFDNDGKRKKVRRNASLIVYQENSRKREMPDIIRVCVAQPPGMKNTDLKKGVALLEEIMGALPNCEYGLWSNGAEIHYKRKLTGDGRIQPDYEDLSDLPGADQTIDDLDQPDVDEGKIPTGDTLKQTFSRIHNYIYGNQGMKKDVAFWQVLNLIFCKIHDERSVIAGERRRFWVKSTERNTEKGRATIANRIKQLFDEVKQDHDYSNVFSDRDAIELDDRVLSFSVSELSRYNLSNADVDVKGAAYEEITSSMLKSGRGQFFTPDNVIKLMIEMMDPGGEADLRNPKNHPRLIDPACGSGRFLTYGLNHVRKKMMAQLYPDLDELLRPMKFAKDKKASDLLRGYARNNLFGIDFDPDLKRAARMNMILNNDGHGNIMSFNSLEFPNIFFRGQSKGEVRSEFAEAQDMPDTVRAWLNADLGTFDFVFTNPPFGAKIPIDDRRILEVFDLAYIWSRDSVGNWSKTGNVQARMAPEVLFVEQCVRWAKPGSGRIAIVLPDGILGNPDMEYVRFWILRECQVLASIDLPVEAFLPQVGVQASLLFLRRKTDTEKNVEVLGSREDFDVFMAVAETVGHDRRGNLIYRRDYDGAEIINEQTLRQIRTTKRGQKVVTKTLRDKSVDDDLPKIGEAYHEFVYRQNRRRK